MRHLITFFISIFLFTYSSESFSAEYSCAKTAYRGKFPVSKIVTDTLCYKRFTIGFSQTVKSPIWVTEHLIKSQQLAENTIRKDRFRPDPNIPLNNQGSLIAFIGTAFDRGHLANVDNMNDDSIAADETFVLTNIVPQYAINNRGIWKALENRVRKLAVEYGEIYVVSGPIFAEPIMKLADDTPIPSKLFKVIIIPSTKEVITYIVPHTQLAKTSELPSYVSTLTALKKDNPSITTVLDGRFNFKTLEHLPDGI